VDDGELKRYFAGRLPIRVAEVEAARDAARGAGWTGEPLRTFHRLAHSLAGAGATFGYFEVTEISHRLESLLRNALAAGAPPAEGEVDGLLRQLRELGTGAPAGTP
jgi:HPt (histidine-containing phosphotransfer) domain-containing protein